VKIRGKKTLPSTPKLLLLLRIQEWADPGKNSLESDQLSIVVQKGIDLAVPT
jgi:hypothetical protein